MTTTHSATALLDLSGQVALITGASRGIGRATAQVFADMGAKVSLVARTTEGLEEVAATLGGDADGPRAIAVPCDVAQEADVARAVARTLDTFGRLDILVNNAGLISFGNVADIDLPEWERGGD